MRLGFGLPQMGPSAGPETLIAVARRAEELGYESLWVADRTLVPVNPRAPYPASADGSLPDLYKRVLDPLDTLTFVAAHTQKIRLGTSVLNVPWYAPVLLARRLATLDVLSGGRLIVGLGIGWSPDEYEVAGVPWKERGARATEIIEALKVIWTSDPVEFRGRHYTIPKSFISLKPLQKPYPPIYVAAYTPLAMQRVATHADAWFPAGIPIAALPETFEGIREMARAAGRDPSAIKLIVRANLAITENAIEGERTDFTGSLVQITDDIHRVSETGAAELLLDVQVGEGSILSVDETLARMEQLKDASGERRRLT
jgi:probable F420-dependent oxidoreductase